MAGQSKITKLVSLRIPLDLLAETRAIAKAVGLSWNGWVVGAIRDKADATESILETTR
jgi:predicted HicB family RNase H-like nuclease